MDGTIVSVGGNGPIASTDPTVGDCFDGIRYLRRSSCDPKLNGGDWIEPGSKLSSARWYSTAQTLADGSVFVASSSLNGLDLPIGITTIPPMKFSHLPEPRRTFWLPWAFSFAASLITCTRSYTFEMALYLFLPPSHPNSSTPPEAQASGVSRFTWWLSYVSQHWLIGTFTSFIF